MSDREEILRDFLYDGNPSDTKILIHIENNTFLLDKENYNNCDFYNKIDKCIKDNDECYTIEIEVIGDDGFVDYSKTHTLWITDCELYIIN